MPRRRRGYVPAVGSDDVSGHRVVRRELIVRRDAPVSWFAATVASGASISAYVATRFLRPHPGVVTESSRPTVAPKPMGRAATTKPSVPAEARGVGRVVQRVDAMQTRRRVIGFPLAVVKKFAFEDRAVTRT